MIEGTIRIDDAEVRKAMRETEGRAGVLMVGLLEQVGTQVVAYLRSLTDEMRPPAVAGEGPRYAHPGHWADISGALANAYRFEVHDRRGRVRWGEVEGNAVVLSGGGPGRKARPPFRLLLANSMEYAVYLEARDGFFVISGAVQPGGELERAIRRAAAAVGWEVK